MKLIRPISVTDLTSNVVETPPAAYDAGTSYDEGDQVSVFGGVSNTTATLYESLVDTNVGNTPASSPDEWQPIGTAYLAYNAGTGYAQGAIVTDTTNHLLYESINPSTNTGEDLTDVSWWLELGPSNRWAMFDEKSATLTTRPLEIRTEIGVMGRVDSVALFSVDASSVNVTVMDGVTEEYSEDFSLISTEGITDWFAYYFEPVVRINELFVTGLPNVLDPAIIVTATDGDNVSIGDLTVGLSIDLGVTVYGAEVGITSYSRVIRDDFGNVTIVSRGYSRYGKFTVYMTKARTDFVYKTLAQYRDIPIVAVGSEEYSSTFIKGLIRLWRIGIEYPSHSVMNIELEGL